jgi:hypothetical protein
MADFASGGSSTGDSAFVAIAHSEVRDGRSVAVRDVVRKVRPPFSSEQVCADFAVLLRSYRISTMAANRWARRFPAEQMRKHGTDKRHSERNKSEIYRDVLAAINSGRCELLDHPRPITQERSQRRLDDVQPARRRRARTGPHNRDSVNHARETPQLFLSS